MLRVLVIELGGVKIYAEVEESKAALLQTIVANIRNTYFAKGKEEC